MKSETTIIYDTIAELEGDLTPALLSLMKWVGTDDLVTWFVRSYFAGDDNDLRSCLSKEDANIILGYYNNHCRKQA